MSERGAQVLFVDDDKLILKAIERVFDGSHIGIRLVEGGEEALRILENEEVAVLVADQCMPGINGIALLAKAKELVPATVRVLMTGYGNFVTAIEAINQGEIFRFIVKPFENRVLIEVVEEALGRYSLCSDLKKANEPALISLAQAIELKDPYTRGHCERVARYSLLLADGLGFSSSMRQEIKHGAWLHDCGKIGIPDTVLNFKGPLENVEFETVKKHCVWGKRLAALARFSDVVQNIIAYHHERFDGEGYPDGLKGAAIPLEARIVAIADNYDALTSDRPYRQALSRQDARNLMFSSSARGFDPQLLELFFALIGRNTSANAKTADGEVE
ncbi:HD-GYP domain-containing protein [Trichloromonas sp.]|uniref:HD-GYP domain-containing protein n=1 Tax=Trichloromonas sp. TaxID=3069249 RepID=UPI003D819F57